MKYSKTLFKQAAAAAGWMLMAAGCVPQRSITTSPAFGVIVPDSAYNARLDVVFQVPGHYFSRRSRLIITPQWRIGDSVGGEYTPLVMDAPVYARKRHRKEVLEGYQDSYAASAVKADKVSHALEVPYSDTVVLPEGTDNARIVGVISTDGCGQCTGIDTIDIARVAAPVPLTDLSTCFRLPWHEPVFQVRPKVHHGKGEARLQFKVDQWDIVTDLADNRRELSRMEETLRPVLQDSLATLTSLSIIGSASAEASYQHNIRLAERRANAALEWLSTRLELPEAARRILKTGAAPEGWEPVVQAMVAAGDSDSVRVRKLMLEHPGPTDDAAEPYIRRLACWSRIRRDYLAKDRKVSYEYSWTVRSFTSDTELLAMYATRPDAFNEEELLRVATLVESDRSRRQVYETVLSYFPESEVAADHLAILYLREGHADEARLLLEGRRQLTPGMRNTLAAIYAFEGDYGKAVGLLDGNELPEARYNLGLLKTRQRRLAEAYKLLRPFADVNSAFAALAVGRTGEADRMMEATDDTTPVAEYVRSIVAARQGDTGAFYTHLTRAVADEKLRLRAASEPDFLRYEQEPRFVRLITQGKEDGR